ncbi:MAG: LytR/AlgR family response regulator transcription factor [Saprospiraceae bacterium]
MRVLIVEDEAPAVRRLTAMLLAIRPQATIVGSCDTSSSAIAMLQREKPDILLCDIELADGLSFRIWDKIDVTCPVIFVTAYDQYAVRAFRVHSLDYLLKPIKEADLEAAILRFEEQNRSPIEPDMMRELLSAVHRKEPQYRTRILTTQGREFVPMSITGILHFYSEDRLCFGVSAEGKSLLVSESISRLAEELNPNDWFQINRGQLVHIDSVVKASQYLNHRLKLSLKPANTTLSNVVARERVTAFKTWMGG